MPVRAAVLDAPGKTPEILDVELDDPRENEVEVAIEAAGVCGSDLHVVAGDWEVPMPVVLGHEGAGVVRRVGPGVADLQPGERRADPSPWDATAACPSRCSRACIRRYRTPVVANLVVGLFGLTALS